jgi:hypothetical protein
VKGAGDRALSLPAAHFKAPLRSADNPMVTTTISPPIRIAALVGVIAAAAIGLGLYLLGRPVDPATLPPPPVHVPRHVSVKPAHAAPTHKATTHKPATHRAGTTHRAATHKTAAHKTTTHRAATQRPATHRSTTQRATPRPKTFATQPSGFPTAVDRAFRTHRVVVLVVYMPGASVDAVVRKEARAGAAATGAGFVQVSALNNALATEVLAKTGVLPEPAVLVLRRPGVVVATLGVTDRQTVVQAVAQAKHPRR